MYALAYYNALLAHRARWLLALDGRVDGYVGEYPSRRLRLLALGFSAVHSINCVLDGRRRLNCVPVGRHPCLAVFLMFTPLPTPTKPPTSLLMPNFISFSTYVLRCIRFVPQVDEADDMLVRFAAWPAKSALEIALLAFF